MIFLTKIEAHGFKTYANFSEINLAYPFISIVGDNGSGKTNVVDAIRWVLGETNAKQLRSETNNDIIFYGSDTQESSDTAEVSLYFDNSEHILNIDKDEVKITRKLKRNNEGSDYYLNDQLVRRKEITDLFLDTGLSKGSLGIISQGKVQNFVDAKPEERAKIFEEAAGIGKYVKSKNEHETELLKVEENLKQLQNNANNLESNIKKLEKESVIAEQYLKCKQELENYELYKAQKQYLYYNRKLSELQTTKDEKAQVLNELQTNQTNSNQQYNVLKNELQEAENKLDAINEEAKAVLLKINDLKEDKVRYEITLKNALNSQNNQVRWQALNQQLVNEQNKLVLLNQKLATETNKRNEIQLVYNTSKNNLESLTEELKKKQIDYQVLNQSLLLLNNQIQNTLKNEHGVQAILNNRDAIPGLIGCLKDLIHTKDAKFNTAVELALGKNINTLVVNTVEDAKLGVTFLKRNQSGIASFMPLNGIKPAEINSNSWRIIQNFEGFVGTADSLIHIDEKYRIVLQSLIGATLIVDNLNTATLLARSVNYSFKIISLDGEIINRGGMVIGGSKIKNFSTLSFEDEKQKIEKGLNELKTLIQTKSQKLDLIRNNFNNLQDDLTLINNNISTYNLQISNVQTNIKGLQKDLNDAKISAPKHDFKNQVNQILQTLSELELKSTTLENALSFQKKKVEELNQKFTNISNELLQKNSKTVSLTNEIASLERVIFLAQTSIEEAKKTANSYKYTIEKVLEKNFQLNLDDTVLQEKILVLESKLETFGAINMNAVNDLKEEQQRYNVLNNEIEDVKQAQENLSAVINNLNKEATKRLKNKIFEINQTLPEFFNKLFRTGSCELRFTNPDDLLNSGIEVMVNSVGKQVHRLNVLSGGEKSIISLSILLTILKTSKFPLIVLDEAESALDPINAEAFATLIKQNSDKAQFLVVTHRKETMVKCDQLLGARKIHGITSMVALTLKGR